MTYELLSDFQYAGSRLAYAINRDQCPYLRGGGQCISGCWTEPSCITDAPCSDGWESEIREAAYELAEESRREARRERGNHGHVKALRDLARWADKIGRKA